MASSVAFPVKLSISMPGQPALAVALSRFGETISDFTPFWNDYFVPTWYSLLQRQYATQGGATGDQWAPLTDQYDAWKQKHWPGQPVGVLTGATRDSLTSPNGAGSVLSISRDRFEIGTNLEYPIYLQMGTRKMVARPPIRVDQSFMTMVGKLLQRFGVDAARKAKLM